MKQVKLQTSLRSFQLENCSIGGNLTVILDFADCARYDVHIEYNTTLQLGWEN